LLSLGLLVHEQQASLKAAADLLKG